MPLKTAHLNAHSVLMRLDHVLERRVYDLSPVVYDMSLEKCKKAQGQHLPTKAYSAEQAVVKMIWLLTVVL